jgi:hypothetical protein
VNASYTAADDKKLSPIHSTTPYLSTGESERFKCTYHVDHKTVLKDPSIAVCNGTFVNSSRTCNEFRPYRYIEEELIPS